MDNIYKIKVGIEEFEVSEKDIPRIVEAMKNNDIVKLDCGLFRGQAILAVCRDLEKEMQRTMLSSHTDTPEEIEQKKNEILLKEQRLNCEKCGHTGWIVGKREGRDCAFPCECKILKTAITKAG